MTLLCRRRRRGPPQLQRPPHCRPRRRLRSPRRRLCVPPPSRRRRRCRRSHRPGRAPSPTAGSTPSPPWVGSGVPLSAGPLVGVDASAADARGGEALGARVMHVPPPGGGASPVAGCSPACRGAGEGGGAPFLSSAPCRVAAAPLAWGTWRPSPPPIRWRRRRRRFRRPRRAACRRGRPRRRHDCQWRRLGRGGRRGGCGARRRRLLDGARQRRARGGGRALGRLHRAPAPLVVSGNAGRDAAPGRVCGGAHRG